MSRRRSPVALILVIVLVLLLLGAFPAWPYNSGWGYYPSSGLGLLLIIVVVVFYFGYYDTPAQRCSRGDLGACLVVNR